MKQIKGLLNIEQFIMMKIIMTTAMKNIIITQTMSIIHTMNIFKIQIRTICKILLKQTIIEVQEISFGGKLKVSS